jgi:Type I restriction modification DNA specificity domain.
MSVKSVPKKGYKMVPWLFQKEIEIPEEWEVVKLDSICDQIQDMDHKMPKKIEKGIPFLSIGDIVNKPEIDFSNQEFISEEDYSKFLKKLQPQKNDLLYSRVATIGESRIIRERKKFAFTYNVVLIKTSDKIESMFLKYALDFPNN